MPGKPFRQSQGTPLAAFFNIPLFYSANLMPRAWDKKAEHRSI